MDYEWDGDGNTVASPSDVSHIPDIGLKGGKLLGNTLQKAFAYEAKSPEPRSPDPSPAARRGISPKKGTDAVDDQNRGRRSRSIDESQEVQASPSTSEALSPATSTGRHVYGNVLGMMMTDVDAGHREGGLV